MSGAILAFFFVVPLLVVIPISFTSDAFVQVPPGGFSLRWYQTVLADAGWLSASINTVIVLFLTVPLVLLVGVPTALFLARGAGERGRAGLLLLLTLPAIVPSVVMATSLFIWFLQLGLVNNLIALAATHALLALPFLVLVLVATLRGLDDRLDWAARSLGANTWESFCTVVLPQLTPALASGCFFAALISLDELLIARAVGGTSTTTLPMQLWVGANEQLSPALAVVSTLSVTLATLGGGLAWLLRRSVKRNSE